MKVIEKPLVIITITLFVLLIVIAVIFLMSG